MAMKDCQGRWLKHCSPVLASSHHTTSPFSLTWPNRSLMTVHLRNIVISLYPYSPHFSVRWTRNAPRNGQPLTDGKQQAPMAKTLQMRCGPSQYFASCATSLSC